MGQAGLLATNLDWHMLDQRGTMIVAGTTPDDEVPSKNGREVFAELGGRFLLRYLLPSQTAIFSAGAETKQFTTPTPYSPEETVAMLALPSPRESREYVLILDPRKIEEVRGPRLVLFGQGIEYILPNGFPEAALVLPWPLEVK
jgi:hypothetical protein